MILMVVSIPNYFHESHGFAAEAIESPRSLLVGSRRMTEVEAYDDEGIVIWRSDFLSSACFPQMMMKNFCLASEPNEV